MGERCCVVRCVVSSRKRRKREGALECQKFKLRATVRLGGCCREVNASHPCISPDLLTLPQSDTDIFIRKAKERLTEA